MPKLTASYKLNEEQLKQLKQIVPEAFKDNILDFNSLYEALSDFLEDDENTDLEQFGLSWPGKCQAKRAAEILPVGTLVPVPGDGVDEDTTRNIYIEGDNLEVLKILKKAYTGRIKMIYIDPPYNTGDDYIYPDDFSESIESFQRRTGQLNENNEKMTTNNRSDGRFHSKWCSMIYPRLRLARELLREDGVIFISIDDNEIANLKNICDEIFGAVNFWGNITWTATNKAMNAGAAKYKIQNSEEYILIYGKITMANHDPFNLYISGIKNYSYTNKNGTYRLEEIQQRKNIGIKRSEKMVFAILGVKPRDGFRWTIGEETARFLEEHGDVELINGKPVRKIYKNDEDEENYHPLWANFSDTCGTSENGKAEVFNLFKNNHGFETVKPVALINKLLFHFTDSDSIILDFFSGTSTTSHSVMQLNSEENGNRQFIMIQIQEIITETSNKEAFDLLNKIRKPFNICEIGKERIRLAGKKIKEEAGLNAANLDTGFKLFRLAPSNYKAWENYTGTDVKQLEELFKADSLMQGWKEDDLLTEIILLEGFPLDSKIEILPQFKKNKIKKISSDFRDNTLYICLDKDIVKETIETLKLNDNNERFICLDSAIDDQSKIRLEDKNLIKTL